MRYVGGKSQEASPMTRFNRSWTRLRSGCWRWNLAKDEHGYGLFFDGRKTVKAHSWIFKKKQGTVPKGHELHHKCEHPWCVNPRHLKPVTHTTNVRLGRAVKKVCRRGHVLTDENRYRHKGLPSGRCLMCKRLEYHLKKK